MTAVMRIDGHGARVTIEDPSLPHQIVLTWTRSSWIAVSCNCLSRGRKRSLPAELIGTRPSWPGGGALKAWRAWHEQRGVSV